MSAASGTYRLRRVGQLRTQQQYRSGVPLVDHLGHRRRLADILVATCPRVLIVGSVQAGRVDPSDLDVVVPPEPEALAEVMGVLDGLGARWEPDGRRPRAIDLLVAGFGRCTTSYGPVDLFVRDPW
jgi:hypothetical protein